MTQKHYIPKFPPEFADYYSHMTKNHYPKGQVEKHMRNVKRIGHLLLNMESFTPQEIASEMGGNSVHKERELRWTVEDYRYFKNASEKRQEQFEILMSIQDKVLV